LLRGQALVGWDVATLRAPWTGALASAWNPLALDPVLIELPHAQLFHDHGAPAWNPYTLLGERTGQFNWPFATYPPAALLYRVCPPWLAQGLHSLLHLIAAGLAALAWLRWRGHGWRPALAGAIAWELSTWATLWLEASFFHSPLAPWAVLAVWGAEAITRSERPLGACLGTAVALGGAILAGHPQLIALLCLATLGVVVARAPRRLGWVGAAVALGCLLGAPRLVPLSSEFLDGHRGAPASWAAHLDTTVRLGPRHLVLTLFPDLLGHPVRGFNLLGPPGMRYANHQEVRLYMGLPALVLACAGFASPRVGRLRWVALGAVVLAFPPFAWLPARLPGLSSSSPARILWVAHLLAPALVAAGWGRLARRDPRVWRGAVGVLGLMLLLALLASTGPGAGMLTPPGRGDPARVASVLAPWGSGLQGDGTPGLARVAGGGRVGVMLSPTLGPLVLGACTCLLMLLAGLDPRPRRRRLAAALLAGLLAAELLREGLVYNPTTTPSRLYPSTLGIAAVESLTRDGGRVLLEAGVATNSLMPFEVRAVGGYGSMHPRRLVRMFEGAGLRPGRQAVRASDLSPAWRQALGVVAVLGPPRSEPTQPVGLTPAHDGGDSRVWAQEAPLPRARVYPAQAVVGVPHEQAAWEQLRAPGFDPRRLVVLEGEGAEAPVPALPRPARFVRDDPERVVVEVDAPEGGVLLLADAWAPGWRATGPHGAALEVEPADVALRAVRLPAGTRGTVTFRYVAPGSRAGLGLGLLAWLAAGLAAWRFRRR
jgi:hypothetical protein